MMCSYSVMPYVLLVEDDNQLRKLLKTVLTIWGYEVCEVSNGATVDAMYQQRRPDLVITDLIMPEKDGLEVIVDLRRTDSSVRIVAISGGCNNITTECHLMMARKLGAQQTLSKPFGTAEFLEAVRLALEPEQAVSNDSIPNAA